jgi:hypothetical protein
MIFAFTTLGDMTLQEVFDECKSGKFAPLLVYEFEGKRVLPYFSSSNICRRFCQRNLPKKWPSGAVHLTTEDLEILAEQNIQVKEFTWPRNIKDVVIWDVHVHEFVNVPEITTDRRGL